MLQVDRIAFPPQVTRKRMSEGNPIPPDPSMTVQVWLYKNAKERRGEEAAERQREALSASIPHSLLNEPATVDRCRAVGWILGAMGEQQQKDVKNVRGQTPQSLDMEPYSDCDTVGDLVQRYVGEHAPTSAVKLVGALKRAFPDSWEMEPGPMEQRRWIFTLRLTCSPEKLRNQLERARLQKGMPGRN